MAQTISVRPALLHSPKVRAIARDIRGRTDFKDWAKAQMGPHSELLARFVLGTLVLVWGAAQEFVTKDGEWHGATLEEVDRVAGVPGFGKLMLEVGYLQQNIGSVTFPNWAEWNGAPEKKARPARQSTIKETPAEAGLDGFDDFWRVYPRRESKIDARTAWGKLKPDAALRARIVEAVVNQCRAKGWTPDLPRERKQYIPLPATWLNGEKWEDEVEAPAQERSWQEILAEQQERSRKWQERRRVVGNGGAQDAVE